MTDMAEIKLYEAMLRIRMVEERIAEEYPRGEIRCPTHLSIGQEAVPAAFSLVAQKTDFAVSTHRSHAHYLAKGGDLRRMIAEIYGKETGCSKGRGGSMHLVDLNVNFMGSTAIVGNTIPIGVGLGLAAKRRGLNEVSYIFLGDGAIEEGVFYESANFAAVRGLPVIFICENNGYSVYSSMHVRQPQGREIHKLAKGIGLDSSHHNGNDSVASLLALKQVTDFVRTEQTPFFLEFDTYRLVEHCGPYDDDHLEYRNLEEIEKWKRLNPIEDVEKVLSLNIADWRSIQKNIQSKIDLEIDEAFSFAKSSLFPDPLTELNSVFA